LTVELLIPSYNRLSILRKTLARVRILYPDLKICLGLQGEMPDPDWQKELSADPLIRVERLAAPSTTATLNHCVVTSRADIVLILDDDAVPHFGWRESHLAAFSADDGLAYTAGREVRASKNSSSFSVFFRIIVESAIGLFLRRDKKLNGRIVGWINMFGIMFGNYDQPGTCRINSPRGCNMAVRREYLVAMSGFNERFRGNAWGFEADFSLRAARDGRYGEYRGDAIVVHYEVPTGGARAHHGVQWFRDFLHNQSLVIDNLGPQGWIGALPRIAKYLLRLARMR
jgi:cellulose synthase/poly-beta-1,6-N-acetylglucosamine synthase-like glycosyltransferase